MQYAMYCLCRHFFFPIVLEITSDRPVTLALLLFSQKVWERSTFSQKAPPRIQTLLRACFYLLFAFFAGETVEALIHPSLQALGVTQVFNEFPALAKAS